LGGTRIQTGDRFIRRDSKPLQCPVDRGIRHYTLLCCISASEDAYYFDDPEVQTGFLPSFGYDAGEMVDSRPGVIFHNTNIISGIFLDPQVFRFNCLRAALSEINPLTKSMPVANILHQVIETCCAKFRLITKSESRFCSNIMVMTRIPDIKLYPPDEFHLSISSLSWPQLSEQ
jgi:hypothetical protein